MDFLRGRTEPWFSSRVGENKGSFGCGHVFMETIIYFITSSVINITDNKIVVDGARFTECKN